ncbi:MAG TPA: VOC family protein, partial [Ilumatobacteraceae bacterium]|nr:VOC family protein [Ilumatobacteraceae bacterium]
PKTVKDRIHLDLHFLEGDDGRDATVARLIDLGATKLWDGQQGPQRWVTMADPEGNEFCVS